MKCYFCKNRKWQDLYIDKRFCEYYICLDCWSELPMYVLNTAQRWKLVQLRGDKISETL